MALIILNEVCKIPLGKAWRMVRPHSKASYESGKQLARRRIKLYRQRYPLNLQEAFEVSGLTLENITDHIGKLLNAKKIVWDPKLEKHVESAHDDMAAKNMGLNQVKSFLEMDKVVRKEAVMGKSEEKTRLILPPKSAGIQEWEDWYQSQEADVLAERTKATEEMRILAEGARLRREGGSPQDR